MTKQIIYFWRETHPSPEEHWFLSQWYVAPFEHEGIQYQTAEMWMMVQKAVLFGDEEIKTQMLATHSPRKHRALGREVKGFDGAKWDQHKFHIVEQGNFHKFSSNPVLRRKLLETGDAELVEASPNDRIWGIGYGANEANADTNRHEWGENLLGKAISRVRSQLGGGDAKETVFPEYETD